MISGADRRGQSLQVGAMLLFGCIVLACTRYQTQGVPAENGQAEFGHSQAVAAELVECHTAVFDTVVDGEPRTATNTLGTDDTDRLLCSYPPAEDVGRTEPSEPINVTRGWS